MTSRRIFGTGLASTLVAACSGGGGGDNAQASNGSSSSSSAPLGAQVAARPTPTSLRGMAEDKNMYFGSAVQSALLTSQPPYAAAIATDCDVVIPETELKWGFQEGAKGNLYTAPGDAIIRFAQSNAVRMRGHTLAWYRNIPDWVTDTLTSGGGGIELLYAHIDQMVAFYKGKVFEWDVVNEAIEPTDGRSDGLRNHLYLQKGGTDYIAECFHRAHAADPDARLYYNENGLEYDTKSNAARRKATLELLTKLKSKGVPVHGFGTQAHLDLSRKFTDSVYAGFLSEVAALGLKISLTELDVDDSSSKADIATRDRLVADHTRAVLDVAFSQPAVIGLATWGITDKYTWLNNFFPRADGLGYRGLPLDEAYQKKPIWTAIYDSFAATSRRATAP